MTLPFKPLPFKPLPLRTLPLRSRTLSAAIIDQLRAEILDGSQPSGSQLRQDALALAYGVSRIPVREALIQLEAEGLVQIVPHKGAVVTSLSPDEVRDVFELRAVLEPRLLAQSVSSLTDEDFSELSAIQQAFDSAIARQDSSQWGLLNAQLHMTMYRRAPLPRTLTIVAGLLQTSERYTRLHLATQQAWHRARAEHDALINLCRQGETAEACTLLADHVTQVQNDLCDMIGALQSQKKA